MSKKILLVGTGPMALEYFKVLKALNTEITVVGRGSQSSLRFEEETGHSPIRGGINEYLANSDVSNIQFVIVAVGTEALMPVMKALIQKGLSNILIEKPAAISIEELVRNKESLQDVLETTKLGYNRRFFGSVIEAQRLIKEDGGLSSIHFEFTEWSHVIAPLEKAPGVKESWFFANSTHIVDLAFHLAGSPTNWSSYTSGKNDWHSPTSFVGSGVTDKNALFSYQANWEAPGRWAVELLTKKRRIYLKPLEAVQIQLLGSVKLEPHEFDNTLDLEFKPGLYLQVEEFINSTGNLLSLGAHIQNSELIYSKMLQNHESRK